MMEAGLKTNSCLCQGAELSAWLWVVFLNKTCAYASKSCLERWPRADYGRMPVWAPAPAQNLDILHLLSILEINRKAWGESLFLHQPCGHRSRQVWMSVNILLAVLKAPSFKQLLPPHLQGCRLFRKTMCASVLHVQRFYEVPKAALRNCLVLPSEPTLFHPGPFSQF